MNTHSTVLNNASAEATTSDRILQIALAAWRQGNIVQVVDQFNDQFTFTDHALGLEFKDKGRLTDFLAKTRELFPDSEKKGQHFISQELLVETFFDCSPPFYICVCSLPQSPLRNSRPRCLPKALPNYPSVLDWSLGILFTSAAIRVSTQPSAKLQTMLRRRPDRSFTRSS